MATKIRLKRIGRRNRPFYRVVVMDSRNRRDGGAIEELGWFNPIDANKSFDLKEDRFMEWLKTGAQPSEAAHGLMKRSGLAHRWHLTQQGLDEKAIEKEMKKWAMNREETKKKRAARADKKLKEAEAKAQADAEASAAAEAAAEEAAETPVEEETAKESTDEAPAEEEAEGPKEEATAEEESAPEAEELTEEVPEEEEASEKTEAEPEVEEEVETPVEEEAAEESTDEAPEKKPAEEETEADVSGDDGDSEEEKTEDA